MPRREVIFKRSLRWLSTCLALLLAAWLGYLCHETRSDTRLWQHSGSGTFWALRADSGRLAIERLESGDSAMAVQGGWVFERANGEERRLILVAVSGVLRNGYGFTSISWNAAKGRIIRMPSGMTLCQWTPGPPAASVKTFFSRVTIPFWTLITVSLLPALLHALHARKQYRRALRAKMNQCACCGYDLRATPDRCPECGSLASTSKEPA